MKSNITATATFLYILFTTVSFAQPTNSIVKNVVMPSPGATAFGKYSEIPVSLGSGLANASVPIYDLQEGPLSLPISIGYHSAGVKVGEMASWVGQNWNLNIGGSISRTILGLADDAGQGYWYVGSSINTTYINVFGNKQSIANGTTDGEPDLYSFSAGAYSGKFFVDKDHIVRQIPIQDVNIEIIGALDGFIVKTPDGTRYIFGKLPGTSTTAYESSQSSNEPSYNKTSYLLLRIETHDQLYKINLNYTDEYYSYKTLGSCKYEFTTCTNAGNVSCNGTGNYDAYHYFITTNVNSKRLSSITTNTGTTTINFTGGSDRLDLDENNGNTTRSKPLDKIEINAGTYCRRWQFYYNYFEDNNYVSTRKEARRLKLDSLGESSCNQTIILPKYKFDYEGTIVNGKLWMPHRLHKAVDHWGFYNGAIGNESVTVNLPPTLQYTPSATTYGSADRESNFTYMLYGALKKITYPVGGSSTFMYEGNTVYTTTQGSPATIFTIQNGTSPLDQACCGTTVTSGFKTLTATEISNGTYKLHLVQTQGTSCSAATFINIVLRVYNGATQVGTTSFNISGGSQILTGTIASIGASTAAVNYKFEITVTDGYGKFEIQTTPTITINKVVGGLRIKELRTNDGSGSSTLDIVKTYDYLDEATPTQSSGVMLKSTSYTYYIPVGGVGSYNWTAETVVPNGAYDGYHIGYRKIRENHNGNGKTIWAFDQNLYTYGSSSMVYPFVPNSGDAQTGKMTKKSDYNSSATLLSEESYTYTKSNSWTSGTDNIVKGLAVVCTGEFPEPPPPPYPNNYFLNSYTINVHGLRTTTSVTTYDGVATTTTYEYDASSRHMAPTAIYFTNSDGVVSRTENKFPYDMSASAVKDSLISRNILVTYETIKKENGTQVDGNRTNYALFSTHPRPGTIERYEYNLSSGSWVTKGTYNTYDASGNPTQFTQTGWQPENYTWQNGMIKTRNFQSHTTTYNYIGSNTRLLSSIQNPDLQTVSFTYDAMIRLFTSNARGGNVVTTYAYVYKGGANTYNSITASSVYTAQTYSSLTNKTDVQYFDGIGRLLQTVKKAHSPGGKDVCTAVTYDMQGRISKEHIPVESTVATGAFVTVLGTHPHRLTAYEPSPLNRPNSITPPTWPYPTTISYTSNAASEVPLNGTASFYAAGLLTKETSTDQQGNVSHTYKDKKGRTIMSRKLNGLDAKTQYVYDAKDRLATVVPPGAALADAGLLFTYTYDAADRMTQKKVPDAASVNMVYNDRDLLAYSQDGNLAALSKHHTNEYDAYGRLTRSGFSTLANLPNAPAFAEILQENFYDGWDGVSQADLNIYPIYRGRLRKSRNKVLGSASDFISEVYSYDTYGRNQNTTGNNHLTLASTNSEVMQRTFDFADNITTENRSHTNGTTPQAFNQRKVYDAQGRLYDYFVSIAGAENHTARYSYNARNELIERNQHYGGSAWLQSVDYSYNDQGWLTTMNQAALGGTNIAFPTCTSSVVNPGTTTTGQADDTKDLFYMQLQYDVLHTGLNGTFRKDGNIAQAVWRVRGRERQAYAYAYDGLQRITSGTYADINDAGTVTASSRYNNSYTYADLRGNISNLQRNGLYLNGACFTQALLDNMTYSYTAGTNKISSIADAGNTTQGGFRASSGAMTYDANGNMISNVAKGITSISYNHLNLPNNITITGGKTIDFTYDAIGIKLRKVVKTGATINLVQEYVNGIEYRGSAIPATTIEGIFHAEGRLYNNAGWKREYTIKDHLGNTRVAYCDLNSDGVVATPSEILQENNYDPFGYELSGVYMNHTNADNLYQYNGKEKNDDHGIGMYDYSARVMDPSIGRFLNIDPNAGKYASLNPYNYVYNNPVNGFDPDGEDGILIVWPDYKIKVGKRKYSGIGHAGVLLIDNKTGHTKYYEYGRYDEAELGFVNSYSVPDAIMDEEGNPTEASINKVLAFISKKSGQNGRIKGAYIKSNLFSEMNDFAQNSIKNNNNPERRTYSITSNNCGTYACDVLKQDPTIRNSAPWIFDPRPNSLINEYQRIFQPLNFEPRPKPNKPKPKPEPKKPEETPKA